MHMNVCRVVAAGLAALVLATGFCVEAARHQYEREQLPSSNYFEVGKAVSQGYLQTKRLAGKVFLAAGGSSLLNARMEEPLQPKKLMAGMYDINTTEPVRVTVVFCPAEEEPVQFLRHAKVLPKDKEALRGTFPGMNRTVKAKRTYDPDKDGMVYIPIGDDRYDVYKRGVDATDGSEALNFGNYGILYRYELPLQGNHKTCLLLSPLGGSYTGSVRVEMNGRESKVVPTPQGRLSFGDRTAPDLALHIGRNMLLNEEFELANIGTYSSYAKFALEYSPPGASNMPVLLILSPQGTPRNTGLFPEKERTIVRETPLHRRRSSSYGQK